MILHPFILAMLLGSIITAGMMLYAGAFGVRLVRFWDVASGSERQLAFERKTVLISTLVGLVMVYDTVSLGLFVATAESLTGHFIGAMCAAGTLYANAYGYPLLIVKILTLTGGGVWLVMHALDVKGYDYPLVRAKYILLLVLTPLVTGETALTFLYFFNLKANVITSCCGALFSLDGPTVSSDIAGLPPEVMFPVTVISLVVTLALGAWTALSRRGRALPLIYGLVNAVMLPLMLMAVVSLISIYIYELPTHRCPFCILQRDYGYIGYFLYIGLFTGAVPGAGLGAVWPFRGRKSLAEAYPAFVRRMAGLSLAGWMLFAAITFINLFFTEFRP